MERNDIIKALECCYVTKSCEGCPYECGHSVCREKRGRDALALIKELAEENERLNERLDREAKCQYDLATKIVNLRDDVKYIKEETVRKMQERVESYIDVGHYRSPTELCFSELDVVNIIRKIAKEMLEGKDDNT